MQEELAEFLRDRFAQRSNATYISLSVIFSVLSASQENIHLFKLGLFIFFLAIISSNSIYILISQKIIKTGVLDRNGNQTETAAPKYPKLHVFAKGGLVVSVIMLISGFFIPEFRENASQVSAETPTQTMTIVSNPDLFIPTFTETFTPSSAEAEIPTPTSTLTGIPVPLPTSIIKLDCFDPNIWTPYEYTNSLVSLRDDGCWDLNPWGFTARDNGIIITPPIAPKGIGHGIYIPIKDITTIKMDVLIKKIEINHGNSSNIAIGIVDNNTPGLNTSRVIYYHYIPSTSLNSIAIKTGEDSEYKDLLDQVLHFDESQELILKVDGPFLTVFINQSEIVELVIPFKEKALWISYSVPDYGEMIATISNLEIK